MWVSSKIQPGSLGTSGYYDPAASPTYVFQNGTLDPKQARMKYHTQLANTGTSDEVRLWYTQWPISRLRCLDIITTVVPCSLYGY